MKTLKLRNIITACVIAGASFSSIAKDQITLNWSRWDVHSGFELTAIADAYMKKHPEVTIKSIDLGSASYNSMVLTQLAGGAKNIDIVTVKDTPGYTDLIRTNTVIELSEKNDGALKENATYQDLVTNLTVDDKLYALPIRLDYWILYYNKDLFDKAGVEYPSNNLTLDQFAALAQKTTQGFGASKTYGSYLHIWRSTVQLASILDGKNTLISSDYSFMKPYYERALMMQDKKWVQSYASLKSSNTHYSGPWYNGTVAMMPMGSWFISAQIENLAKGQSKVKNWGIVRFPHPEGVEPGTTAATVTSLAVNVNSDKKEAALDFIRFAAGEEGALAVAQAGGFPANQTDETIKIASSRSGFPQDTNSLETLKIGKTYLEMPVDPATPRVEVILNRTHDAIMTESEDIDEAIALLNEDVAKVLNKK